MKEPIYLGVNVDHVANIREARAVRYPDPVHVALQAELAGADSITMHLRKDRLHIQDHDIERFVASAQTKLNLEIAPTRHMVDLALQFSPKNVCLVPENRQEHTTVKGIDVLQQSDELLEYVEALQSTGISCTIFIDPEEEQIEAAARLGAATVELNTGHYSAAESAIDRSSELSRIMSCCDYAFSLGLTVNAGHGLHYDNVQAIAEIESINELGVGHSVVARALYAGIPAAVAKMKRLMVEARHR
ncbi:MAG: pyridoxine 5'-phosphate synthase [Granulosicoccus sp.]